MRTLTVLKTEHIRVLRSLARRNGYSKRGDLWYEWTKDLKSVQCNVCGEHFDLDVVMDQHGFDHLKEYNLLAFI